jgi:hypothetical protein
VALIIADAIRAMNIDRFPDDEWVLRTAPNQPWPHANPEEPDGQCAGSGTLRPEYQHANRETPRNPNDGSSDQTAPEIQKSNAAHRLFARRIDIQEPPATFERAASSGSDVLV